MGQARVTRSRELSLNRYTQTLQWTRIAYRLKPSLHTSHMKISSFIAAIVIALALASVGCSASGRINVQNTPSSKLSADTQVAYVTKPVVAPRE
jgi:hypothetical protein